MPLCDASQSSEFRGASHGTGAQVAAEGLPTSGGTSRRSGETATFASAAHYRHPGTETILLVDDEEMVRKFVRAVLERFGYHVLEAGTPEELDHLREHHQGVIDLLLTDVVMPGRTGPEVSELLRGQYPDLKVLYMSGHTDDAVFRQGVRLAALAFIQKPFSPIALAQKIQELLD